MAVVAVASMCYTRSRSRRTRSIWFEIISFPCPTNKASADHNPGRRSAPTSLSTSEPQKRLVSSDAARTEPLARIRRAALDVLTVLRELEESARIPLSDDAYDVGSDRSSPSRVLSPTELSDVPTDASFSLSVMRVGGRRESILVWDEEEYDFNVDEEDGRVPRERWDERLVLGSGCTKLGKQQDAIAQHLDTVDEVLFCGTKGGVRGWTSEKERMEKLEREARGKVRKSSVPFPEIDSIASEQATEAVGSGDSARRVESADMLNTLQDLSITEEPEALQTLAGGEHDYVDYADGPAVDDNDLPRWAQRSAFPDGELSRTHALLVALLPASLLPHLPTSPDRADLLNALSSGHLLCVAYDIGARQSRKPWGYINDESIHDIVALEDALSASAANGLQTEKGRKGWTFRRTDNLRLWGAWVLPLFLSNHVSRANDGYDTSGKPLIYFSLLFCTFSCIFEKSMKKYKKAQSSTFFRLFQGGQKSRPLLLQSTLFFAWTFPWSRDPVPPSRQAPSAQEPVTHYIPQCYATRPHEQATTPYEPTPCGGPPSSYGHAPSHVYRATTRAPCPGAPCRAPCPHPLEYPPPPVLLYGGVRRTHD